MKKPFKKSGQKLARRFSRLSRKAGEESREHVEANVIRRFSHVRLVRLNVLEWFLLVFAVILLAVTQANWYADTYSVSSFASGGTFTEATLGKVSSLNPLFASTNSEKTLARLLFSNLAENDYSGHTGLGLADSISSSSDAKVWRIHLRDGLKWSDGEPITNADVLFTINLIKNPAVSTSYASNLSGVKVTEDEGAIVFTLPSPYADFVSVLNFPILPQHILESVEPANLNESSFSKKPISSGAFSFNASQPVGSAGEVVVYLSANEYYYRGRPLLDSFAVHAYPDLDMIIASLNSNSVTATAELSEADKSKLISNRFYEKQTALNSGVFAFFNTSRGAMSNKTYRQAIQKGISVSELREVAGSVPALDYPILKNQFALSAWPDFPAYDKASATKTLSDAGLTEDSAPLNLVTVNSGSLPAVAESFAEQLRSLGFNVNVTSYDPTQDFISSVIRPRAYDILIYEIDLGADADLFAYYHSSQSGQNGYNLSNYNNPLVDDLILAARETVDPSLRTATYESFLRYWVADIPAIGLYQSNLSYFYNKNSRTFSTDSILVVPTDRFSEVNFWSVEKTVLNRTP